MKKLNLIALLVAGALLTPTFSSLAAGLEGTEGVDNKDATSTGHITLGLDEDGNEGGDTEDPTDPILPVDPDEEDGEDEDGDTGNTGALRIDWVTPFEFGSHELSSGTQIYTLERNENPFVQVSDFRGTGQGWVLQVKASEFINDENKVLKGAELSLPAGTVSPYGENQSIKPESKAVVLSNELAEIMVATQDGGMGTWANEFDKESVTLTVPSGNYAGDYQAEITWTLTDAILN